VILGSDVIVRLSEKEVVLVRPNAAARDVRGKSGQQREFVRQMEDLFGARPSGV
jgi:hypothetical protein